MPRLTFPLVAGVPVLDLHVLPTAAPAGAGTAGASAAGTVTVRALVDTSATRTGIDAAALRPLGLTPVMLTGIRTASTGRVPLASPVYEVALAVPGPPPVSWMAVVRVAAVDLSWSRYKFLVDRDVLNGCRFAYDGPAGQFTLEF